MLLGAYVTGAFVTIEGAGVLGAVVSRGLTGAAVVGAMVGSGDKVGKLVTGVAVGLAAKRGANGTVHPESKTQKSQAATRREGSGKCVSGNHTQEAIPAASCFSLHAPSPVASRLRISRGC